MATIVIIDDEAPLRETLCDLLSTAHHTVLGFGNARAGVAQCRMLPIDLVVTDLLMPGEDGFQTIRALRTLQPAPKILALTGMPGSASQDILACAEQHGADRALAKPLKLAALLAVVRELLGEGEPGPHA